ncbi:MAG: histidine--tRNA ligase [Cryomorphaceae bacterium]|nr:histidine--tRNA ligase [Cryomorphaceae bacterium]
MSKVSIAKGMRDFSALEVSRRQYIIGQIKQVFENYAFQPLETPSMENLSTLTGKYGDEGDKLIFRVLKSGDFLKSVPDNLPRDAHKWSPMVSDKALRYDLTVPFARYIATNRNDIKLPFKRYQIQPVWRADRPQKGRFREFYQCDADVVGSDSLFQEVELMLIYATVFEKLGLKVNIRISSRSVLNGLAAYAGVADKFSTFCTILDKVDKIGEAAVMQQWIEMGVTPEAADQIRIAIGTRGENAFGAMEKFREMDKALADLRFIIQQFENNFSGKASLIFDPSLARGLDYYTGAIFEVECPDVAIGSIGGGGRYADLTGIFGVKDVPGVGISFGLDRIYLALEERNLFPVDVNDGPQILGVNFGEKADVKTFGLITQLREKGIRSEFYPQKAKLKKQLDYANQLDISYVLMMGEEEMANNSIVLKNMRTGEQKVLPQDVAEVMNAI